MKTQWRWAPVAAAWAALACAGCGGGNAGNNNGLGTSPTQSYYAYVAESTSGNIAAYSEASGKFTAVGSPVGGNSDNCGLTVSPNNQFLYSVTCEQGWIQPYAINASTGALTAVGSGTSVNIPSASGGYLTPLVISPNGKFAYIVNEGSLQQSVVAYSIGSDGSLSAAGSPVALNTGGCVHMQIAMAPSGNYLYVSYWCIGEVIAFSVDANSGTLTEVAGSPFLLEDGGTNGPAGRDPESLAVAPSGNFVYGPNSGGGISMFSVAAGTGILTAMPYFYDTTPFSHDVGSMVIDSSGANAYVQCPNSACIVAYSVNTSTGALSQTELTPGSNTMGEGIALDPTGKYLLAAWIQGPSGVGGEVSSYSIDPTTGAVTYMGAVAGTSGTEPAAIAFATE